MVGKSYPKLDKKILKVLKSANKPLNTGEVSKKVGVAWWTGQTHLLGLLSKGKVKHKKIGTNHQWEVK